MSMACIGRGTIDPGPQEAILRPAPAAEGIRESPSSAAAFATLLTNRNPGGQHGGGSAEQNQAGRRHGRYPLQAHQGRASARSGDPSPKGCPLCEKHNSQHTSARRSLLKRVSSTLQPYLRKVGDNRLLRLPCTGRSGLLLIEPIRDCILHGSVHPHQRLSG